MFQQVVFNVEVSQRDNRLLAKRDIGSSSPGGVLLVTTLYIDKLSHAPRILNLGSLCTAHSDRPTLQIKQLFA